ncbi:MAG TPA: hypothetical protein VNZ58_13885 [Thermomicrobiales bacterium]|nr:hypothetical protein [Thermomicrobiales bacterium]
MPDKPRIINLDDARRKQAGQPSLADAMSWMEEIEDALETMDKAGVTTRDELQALLNRLESDTPPDGK